MPNIKERTIVMFKPDALQRGVLGEVIHRFERKGLKIVAFKMIRLSDALLEEHYSHHKDKDFFADFKKFMKSSPVVVLALEGLNAVKVVRDMAGPTAGHSAPPGTIRGDFAISTGPNIIHVSESPEISATELKRFFNPEDFFEYDRSDFGVLYAKEDMK